MNRIDLEGRVAIVTGGARGIGRAIADRLSASGARVAIWDIDAAAAANTAASIMNAVDFTADVTEPASIAAALAATTAQIGAPDILINNAGITGPNHPLDQYPIDAWRQVIEIDLMGVFYCCRAVVPVMRQRDRGHIVNIASIAGKEGNPNASAYSAAKAGVIGLTKSLGKELAETGIRVNAVAPGPTDTPLLAPDSLWRKPGYLATLPLGRLVTPEEIAATVYYLATEGSMYCGEVISPNAGAVI